MIKDKSGECYDVPTVWQINNVHFPRKQWHWFIDSKTARSMNHIVYGYFMRVKLAPYITAYEGAIGDHYKNNFRPRLTNLMIRALLLYRHNPQHYGHNPMFVVMKVLGYWNSILFTRIVMCNNNGHQLPVPPDGYNVTKPKMVEIATHIFNCFEPVVNEMYPLYIARLARIEKKKLNG
jgi:hypothetical protein